ncbi:protein of unknown function [Rhodovastum atsumiense]|nr:protein of unknown function [Rhodovastum atsumiense]
MPARQGGSGPDPRLIVSSQLNTGPRLAFPFRYLNYG